MQEVSKVQVNSFVLKVIAIICMLIDHTSIVLDPFIPNEWYDLYKTGRMIGRTAFPLFCFMIVEGYYHTRDKSRYLGSLLLLAIISELPFDAIFSESGFKLEYDNQNVFFTLATGLFTIILLDNVNKFMKSISEKQRAYLGYAFIVANIILQFFIIIIMTIGINYLKSDYGVAGLDLIVMIYYFEKIPVLLKRFDGRFDSNKAKFIFAGLTVLFWISYYDYKIGRISELMGFPAVILIWMYNGKRGDYKIPKYVFYFFYPVHLTVLYFIRKMLAGY